MPGVADRLLLRAANRRRLTADVTTALDGVERSGSMEEAPELTLTIADPRHELMTSSVLVRPAVRAVGSPEAFTLRPLDLELDGVWYRLDGADREDDHVALSFKLRNVVWMGEHDWALSASRNASTRALFIRRQVLEVGRKRPAAQRLAFWAPEVGKRMPVAKSGSETSSRSESDRDPSKTLTRAKNAKGLTVKGRKADAEQRRNMAIAAEEAESTGAGPKATLSLHVAAIGESQYRRGAAEQVYGTHKGVWQSNQIPPGDVRAQAHHFLVGGRSFRAGGAIQAARDHPTWSVGQIAQYVEISDGSAAYYDGFAGEGRKIVDAFGGAGGGTGVGGSYVKSYRYRRDEGEDAWSCTERLAGEVQRRRFVTIIGGSSELFVYSDDDHLLRLPSQATLSPDADYVTGWRYSLSYGKTARELVVKVLAEDAGDLTWGLPVNVESGEPDDGKWLVWDAHEVDGGPEVELTLRAPQQAKPEPASDTVSRGADETDTGSDADTATEKAYSAAFRIGQKNYPYVWGGGHAHAGRPDRGTGRDPGIGYDCSGYTAAQLLAAGMLPDSWTHGGPASGTFASSYGEPGEGEHLTVWANGVHVFIEYKIKGKRGRYGDTSRQAGGPNAPSGPHLRYGTRSTAGFTPRHWPGT